MLGLAAPALCLYFDLTSNPEEPLYWFQRSGALAVIFSAWSEFKLLSIHGDINPSGVSYSLNTEIKDEYGAQYKLTSIVVIFVAISGTLIWAYGDLVV